MQRPYCMQTGRSVSSKYRGEPLAVYASVAGNQERVQQVLQKAAVPPAPSVRKRGSRRRYNEDGVKRRLPLFTQHLEPDTNEAETFALHFALQYEEAESERRPAGHTSEAEREKVVSAALAAAVSRIRNIFQQGGRLRLSPEREGNIAQGHMMKRTVTAPSRPYGIGSHSSTAGAHASQPQQTTNSQLSGPSIPTAAVSSHTPPVPAVVTVRANSIPVSGEVRNRFDEAEAMPLVPQQLLSFERQGWTCVRELFGRKEIEHIHTAVLPILEARELEALQQRIRVLCPGVDPCVARTQEAALNILAQHSEEPLGFLQFFNLNKSVPLIRELACSKRLASMAGALLGTRRVRLYQDCVFLKHSGYAETNWHSDLRMTPFDTNHFVTVWIPLRPIKGPGDSGLIFAGGSHRDFSLLFWHEDITKMDLVERGYRIASAGKMEWGDVTWHHGWTLHSSPPQPPGSPPRLALAFSYFADGAKIRLREGQNLRPGAHHSEDLESYQDWLPDVVPGKAADHALLPLVHSC